LQIPAHSFSLIYMQNVETLSLSHPCLSCQNWELLSQTSQPLVIPINKKRQRQDRISIMRRCGYGLAEGHGRPGPWGSG